MSFASDIQSVTKTDTTQGVNGRSRLAGLYYTCTATPGSITLKTGGASGQTRLSLATPGAAGAYDLIIPDDGVLFEDGIHITRSGAEVVSVTLLFVGGAAA